MKNNISRKIATGLFWSYAERFLAQGITLIVSVVLARILVPEHYGIIAIVSVFINICDALVTGGFGNALIQKKNVSEEDFDSICWVSIGIAIILYIILFIGSPYIALFYDNRLLSPIIKVMGLKFIFSAFNSVQQAYVQKKMLFKRFFFATLGGTIFSAFLGVGMALKGLGAWALVGQYLSNTIIDTFILYLTIDWKPRFRISKNSVKELWGFGFSMLASTMVYTLKDNIRSLFIGKKFTSSDLAYYNQGKKYPQLLVTDIVESLGKVMFPVLSSEQDSKDSIKSIVRKSVRVSSFVLTPCVIGILSVADNFIEVILTSKWSPAVPYLRILSLVYLTRSLTTIFQKSLLAIGKSSVNLLHEVVTSVVTIALLLVSVFYYHSIVLIAWSYVLVMIIGMAIFAFFVKKEFSYTYLEMAKDYFPMFILSVIMGCVAFGIGLLPVASFPKLMLQIIGGGIVYLVLSLMLQLEGCLYIMNLLKLCKNKRNNKKKD